METIALIGVGKMGAPIADRLRLAGYALRVFDSSADRREVSARRGLAVATSVADACDGAAWALLCLPDSTAVESAICGVNGLFRSPCPAPVCIDLTSSSPATTVRLAGVLRQRDVTFLDAPVSGGVAGAVAGTLTAMVGGNRAEHDRIKPLLQSFASTVTWAGPLGAGHAAKAINNALSALALTVTAEMMATGTVAGLDADRLLESINRGSGRTQASEVKYPRFILNGSYASEFLLSQMLKDIGVACEMAVTTGTPVPLTAVLAQIWVAALAGLGPSADSTQIAQFLGVQSSPTSGERLKPEPDDPAAEALRWLDISIFAACLVGAIEMLPLGKAYHLEPARLLAIINASSGRSEGTRHLAGQHDGSPGAIRLTIRQVLSAMDWAHATAKRANLFVPATTLAAELLRQAGRRFAWTAELGALMQAPVRV